MEQKISSQMDKFQPTQPNQYLLKVNDLIAPIRMQRLTDWIKQQHLNSMSYQRSQPGKKGHKKIKKSVQIILICKPMIIYVEQPEESTKKLQALISDFIRNQGTITPYKNQLYFYYQQQTSRNENFTSKNMKYLGIHLTKYV